MNDESLEKLADHLNGTCETVSEAVNKLQLDCNGLDDVEIETLLAPWEVARCECCSWWFESWQLSPPNEMYDELTCDDCRDDWGK